MVQQHSSRLLLGAQYAAVALGALWMGVALAAGQPLMAVAATWLLALMLFVRLLHSHTLVLKPLAPHAPLPRRAAAPPLGLDPVHVRALEELLGRRLEPPDGDDRAP
jgi:hypothetical protein